MTKALYIAGPMSGYPEHNFPAFFEAEKLLVEAGYQTFNPAKFEVNPQETWETCMRRDLVMMLENATGIALLDGWHRSSGAILECHIATSLNIPTDPVSIWLSKSREGVSNAQG